MKVECSECGKKINIPDEKIPPNKKVSISCPSCKTKITVEKPPEKEKAEKEAPAAAPPEESPQDQLEEMDPTQFADEELDGLEAGAKRALVCDTKNQKKIVSVLKELGYVSKESKSDSEAVGRMRFTQYDAVIIAEDFCCTELKNNNVLKYIQPMPMTPRRKMFVALIGDNFRTMDNMQAYSLSVNMVINSKDIGNLSAILKKSIAENDAFYKVFKETLTALGKT